MDEEHIRLRLVTAMKRARTETYGPRPADFSRATNISPSQISRWESGKTLPTVIQLIRFAEHCQMSVEQLIQGLSEPKAERLLLGLDEESQVVVVGLVD